MVKNSIKIFHFEMFLYFRATSVKLNKIIEGIKMSQEFDMKELYNCADKFINLANDLSQKDTSGTVGTALRFAAARYSAFELSVVSEDFEGEKEVIKKRLLDDYSLMLEENIESYIKHIKENR